jgi:hypothetical protein
LNAPIGGIVSNSAIVPAGANGGITVFGSHDTHLVIDINGYFAANGTAMSGIISDTGGVIALPSGASVTHPGTGQYTISFPAGTFAPSDTVTQPVPVAVFSAISNTPITTNTVNYVLPVDGSAAITVSWLVNGNLTNTGFAFHIVQN